MIDRTHTLPVVQQCKVLQLARSTAYYQPKPISTEDLRLMRLIDEIHIEYPFMGARQIKRMLVNDGHAVGRKRVGRLMRVMGLEALYCRPKTTKRNPAHPVYPYLLRGMTINRPNQVWAMDISYIPMAKGFVYLTAVMDWATRRILSWRLSNTMTTDFCIEAVEEAIAKYGTPEIFNTDQGSQFTSMEFTGLLKAHDIQISMDGKGAWRDNVFVERFWRSIKYEEVYLHGYASVSEARTSMERYIHFYNTRRPHSALDGQPPDSVYFTSMPQLQAA